MIPYTEVTFFILSLVVLLGLCLLFFGGELLCKGAESLALILGVNPIIIGLTIVAMATSMPELFTSLYGAMHNSPGIAIGNIVGSNLANIGLILGLSALVAPIAVHSRLVKKELPFLFIITVLFYLMASSGLIGHIYGIVLIAFMAGYLFFLIKNAKKEDPLVKESVEEEVSHMRTSKLMAWGFILAGAVALHFGAQFLVDASVEVATRLGVSELLVGLTIVAVGTSLPELAASISAARRGQVEICAGNIIGSNIFNILFIIGSVSSFFPIEVNSSLLKLEFPAMLVLTLLLWRVFSRDEIISKREGILLISLYAVIIAVSAYFQM